MRRITIWIALGGLWMIPPAHADERQAADFARKAASGGRMEVRLGEVAKTNAASEDVRAFGLRMVTDHSKANRELEAEAQRLGIALPSEMSKDDAERVAKLEKLHGTAFDRSYMDAMVKDHEEDVKAFRAEAKDTDSPLQAFAEKTTPTLESHLEQARRVKAALGAEGIGSTARRDPRPGSTRP